MKRLIILMQLIMLKGDFHLPMRQLSFRVVVASWCLAAFVLVNAYSTTLFAYLMVPKLLPTAKSFDDLAAGYPQNLKVLIEKGSVMANDFLVRQNMHQSQYKNIVLNTISYRQPHLDRIK